MKHPVILAKLLIAKGPFPLRAWNGAFFISFIDLFRFSNHWRKSLIKESLYIQKLNQPMNIDKKSIPLYLFNT